MGRKRSRLQLVPFLVPLQLCRHSLCPRGHPQKGWSHGGCAALPSCWARAKQFGSEAPGALRQPRQARLGQDVFGSQSLGGHKIGHLRICFRKKNYISDWRSDTNHMRCRLHTYSAESPSWQGQIVQGKQDPSPLPISRILWIFFLLGAESSLGLEGKNSVTGQSHFQLR